MEEGNLYQPVAQQGGSWERKVPISLFSYSLITCQLLPSSETYQKSECKGAHDVVHKGHPLGEQIRMEECGEWKWRVKQKVSTQIYLFSYQ